MTDECGADTADGGTCGFNGKYPDGRCGHHTDHTPDRKQSKLEANPEVVDLVIQEIEHGATVSEALAEVEEKTGVFIAQSTHGNWLSKGRDDSNPDIYAEYRKGVTRARKTGKRRDRDTIKRRAQEKDDVRLLWKIHKEQYGDEYDSDTELDVEKVELIMQSDETNYAPSQD
jgi:hypothetical protein